MGTMGRLRDVKVRAWDWKRYLGRDDITKTLNVLQWVVRRKEASQVSKQGGRNPKSLQKEEKQDQS